MVLTQQCVKKKNMKAINHSEADLFRYIQTDNVNAFIERYEGSEDIRKDTINSEKTTYLGECVKRCALKIAGYITKNSNEIDVIDGNGNKAISYVKLFNKNDIVMIDLFYEKGMDFSKSIGLKGNILHVISPRCNQETFDKYVSLGASPYETDISGNLPKHIAQRWQNKSIVSHIDNNYGDYSIDLAV
jgi:ankyrin repeat protein